VAPERALVVALEQWVRDGTPPPPSCVPRVDQGTAVDRARVIDRFRTRAGVATPTVDALPAGPGVARTALVSAVDDDGNEIAGVRLPALVEPVAAYTGWNVRLPIPGRPDLVPDFLGSRLPFAVDRITERYASRDEYERRARAAADELVGRRLLLPDDVDLVVRAAVRAYEQSVEPHAANTP
jgi:Alpha/beta hydrolase domain